MIILQVNVHVHVSNDEPILKNEKYKLLNKNDTSSAIVFREVSSLDHEVLNNSMKFATFITFSYRLLRQLVKILYGLRNCFTEQSYFNTTQFFITNLDIEENLKSLSFSNFYNNAVKIETL